MCFDVSEVVLSGRARAILQLIREWSPSKSGLGSPQYSKENKHKISSEQGEFLRCSSNLGVPRNHWSEHWYCLREVTPRCYRFHLCPPPGIPPHIKQLHPIRSRFGSPFAMQWNIMDGPSYLVPGFVPQFLLHPCLYSAPNLLALLLVSCCQSHTCTLDRSGHWILGTSS